MNKPVAPVTAKKIVHPVAKNEHRYNFALNKTNADIALPGMPHDLKGQGIYVYVTLNGGEVPDEALRIELRNWVRKEIGPIASPDLIHWAPGLAKTRSGKIMRHILRKIATGAYDALGDISTLAAPVFVAHRIETHKTMNAG